VTTAAGEAGAARFARTIEQRATRAHGRRTLQALLEAAVEELSTHGYHGARMSRIARRAGTAHGTLYVYFTDKADLLAALYAEAAGELEPVLLAVPALRAGEEGFAELQAWVRHVCDVFLRHGAVLQALAESMDDGGAPAAGRAAMRVLGRTSRRIAERIREAGPVGLDPEIAALVVWALIEGSARALFRGELLVDLDDLAAGVAELLQRSVFGTAQGL
jgi:AcrR family transcriptional regulator